MNAVTRRNQILEAFRTSDAPISASALAAQLDVSRQVIVGDVALLRASGHDITATSRGYMLVANSNSVIKGQYLGKIVSRHAPEDTKDELYEITDQGGSVINVIVEHEIYGEITGSLNLETRSDVDAFLTKLESSQDKLLLSLSHHGVHMHTIACRDKAHFNSIVQALKSKNLLLENNS